MTWVHNRFESWFRSLTAWSATGSMYLYSWSWVFPGR